MRGGEAGRELRDEAAREVEEPREPDVDAGRAGQGDAVHDVGFLAGDEPRPTDAVAADIHERAAIEIGPQPDVGRPFLDVAERGPDRLECPDRRQALDEAAGLGMMAPHEGFRQDEAGPVGSIERLVDLRRMARVRSVSESQSHRGRNRQLRRGGSAGARRQVRTRLDADCSLMVCPASASSRWKTKASGQCKFVAALRQSPGSAAPGFIFESIRVRRIPETVSKIPFAGQKKRYDQIGYGSPHRSTGLRQIPRRLSLLI